MKYPYIGKYHYRKSYCYALFVKPGIGMRLHQSESENTGYRETKLGLRVGLNELAFNEYKASHKNWEGIREDKADPEL